MSQCHRQTDDPDLPKRTALADQVGRHQRFPVTWREGVQPSQEHGYPQGEQRESQSQVTR